MIRYVNRFFAIRKSFLIIFVYNNDNSKIQNRRRFFPPVLNSAAYSCLSASSTLQSLVINFLVESQLVNPAPKRSAAYI